GRATDLSGYGAGGGGNPLGPAKSTSSYRQLGDSCEYTSSCQPPLICEGKKCVNEKIKRTGSASLNKGCGDDGDCVSPYVCYSGVCKSRSGGECSSSSDCYDNHYCSSENGHCRKIDDYWVGDKSVEGVTVNSLLRGESTTTDTATKTTTDITTKTGTTTDTATKTTTDTTTEIPTKTTTDTTTKIPTEIPTKTTTDTTTKTPTKTTTDDDDDDTVVANTKIYFYESSDGCVSTDSYTSLVGCILANHRICYLSLDACQSTSVLVLYGDVNGDGVVNAMDFSFIKTKFGSLVVSGDKADLEPDGIINYYDYLLIRAILDGDVVM
ncbi:MAG: hypothetical protein EOM11_09795, partial [Erysipelotrichia bacterium]|nr:hypothetical protein [Erysipelotrichia bacterium]